MPTVFDVLSTLGFEHVLLWLLTFAIVNGLMAQAKMLDNARETRAIIGIVAGLFVVMATPGELITIISNMSAGMILVVMTLLVVFIFIEALGVKGTQKREIKDKEGNVHTIQEPVAYFTKHGYIMAAVLIIVAVLIFFGSGGGALLGLTSFEVTEETMTSIVLIIVVMIAIIWLISGEKAK